MKKAQMSNIVKIIMILVTFVLVSAVLVQFANLAKGSSKEAQCNYAISQMRLIAEKTFGFNQEVEDYFSSIVDLNNLIKANCITRQSTIDSQDLYTELDKRFERCTNTYYNKFNPYYAVPTKFGSEPVETYGSMFCVVCDDLELEKEVTFSQLDYSKHRTAKGLKSEYDYIGKYHLSTDQQAILDAGVIYQTGTDKTARLDEFNEAQKNSWILGNIGFFNENWESGSFSTNKYSVVLLHSDFNGDMSGDNPIMAVVPQDSTYYKYLPNNDHYEYAIQNRLFNSPSWLTEQYKSIAYDFPENDLYTSCTRFNVIDE